MTRLANHSKDKETFYVPLKKKASPWSTERVARYKKEKEKALKIHRKVKKIVDGLLATHFDAQVYVADASGISRSQLSRVYGGKGSFSTDLAEYVLAHVNHLRKEWCADKKVTPGNAWENSGIVELETENVGLEAENARLQGELRGANSHIDLLRDRAKWKVKETTKAFWLLNIIWTIVLLASIYFALKF